MPPGISEAVMIALIKALMELVIEAAKKEGLLPARSLVINDYYDISIEVVKLLYRIITSLNLDVDEIKLSDFVLKTIGELLSE